MTTPYTEFTITNSLERYLESCTFRNDKLIEATLTEKTPLINTIKVALGVKLVCS
jgi:hypothetical protein